MSTLSTFLRHLHDTVILLGGDKHIAELLNHPELITEKDVLDLQLYTMRLMDSTKDRIVSINSRTVTVRKH